MKVQIDLDSPTPVYRQLADAIRLHLVTGTIKQGDQLPPVRQLALDLGIHYGTVAQSYRLLAEEGWLHLQRRRGAVVVPRSSRTTRRQPSGKPHAIRLRELVAGLRAAGADPRRIAADLRAIAAELEDSLCSSE